MKMLRHVFIITGVLALLLLGSLSVALAHPGEPDNIWIGPPPEEPVFCILIWAPVHDAQGNTYSNSCFAAADGVRVTWNGEGHSLDPDSAAR